MNMLPFVVRALLGIIGYFIFGVDGAVGGVGMGIVLSLAATVKDMYESR